MEDSRVSDSGASLDGGAIQVGRLESVQLGMPRERVMEQAADGRPVAWVSGIFKHAAGGSARVTAEGIEGDGQADLENHGGPDNVVLAYDAAHYPVWRERLGMGMEHGSFGENFTVLGFSDETVCIGDVWEVGSELRLQVTQARQPCFKLARRLGQPEIVKMVRANSWGGWYLRVLHAGVAEAGMEIRRVERHHAAWTVARAVQVMYNRKVDRGSAAELAQLAELSARWKRELLG